MGNPQNSYAQEWVWRYSNAKGIAKYVFLAIARRVMRGKAETGPLPTETLVHDTGLGDATVRRKVAELADKHDEIEIIKADRRGTTYRYRLRRELKLPFSDPEVINGQRSERPVTPLRLTTDSGESAVVTASGDSAQSERSDCSGGAVSPVGVSADGGAVSFSSEVRTEVPSTTTTEEQAAAAFLEWFLVAHREHRGVLYRVHNPAKAEAAVRELLTGRTTERVQAMAVAMWKDTADPWLNDRATPNDRGVFSLLHKSPYLEALVVRAEKPAAGGYDATARCPHSPKCLSPWECTAYNKNAEAVG